MIPLGKSLRYLWLGLRNAVLRRGTPPFVTLFVTSRCNARCDHCFYWQEIESGAGSSELSLDEFRRISRSMGEIYNLLISGGEPFLRGDLADICLEFCRTNRVSHLVIPTNAFLPHTVVPQAERMVSGCPDTRVVVQISIDGPPALHEEIRGTPGGFERLEETYAGLRRLKERLGGPGVTFCLTVTAANQDRLIETIKYIRERFHRPNINLIYVRGKPRDPALTGVDPARYREALEYLVEDERCGGRWRGRSFSEGLYLVRRELESSLILDTVERGRRLLPCTAGRLTCVIDQTGNVWPCELLNKKMGNLREAGYDFRKVWERREAVLARSYIAAGDCHCTQETNIMSNLTFSPRTLIYYLKKLRCRP